MTLPIRRIPGAEAIAGPDPSRIDFAESRRSGSITVTKAQPGAGAACGGGSGTLLIAPWHRDPHPDHKACGRAAAGIRILKSAEVDILADGTLDYPGELLKELDRTLCSLHSRFGLGKQEQTDRMLRAMDNRYFNILGHGTGRLLLKRPGYELDRAIRDRSGSPRRTGIGFRSELFAMVLACAPVPALMNNG